MGSTCPRSTTDQTFVFFLFQRTHLHDQSTFIYDRVEEIPEISNGGDGNGNNITQNFDPNME